jgi:hypothetical protein
LVAVIALGGAALADAFRDREAAGVGADQTTATASTTEGRAEPELRLPGMAAPGRIVFTEPPSCELRAFDIQAGRFVDLPPVATTCELWAPRVGTHVAFVVPDDFGGSIRHFSVRNLDDPQAGFREYTAAGPVAWSSDGSKLAWCGTDGSGFELSFGRKPVRLNRCVWAYGPGGVRVSVKFGPQAATRRAAKMVIGKAPPITIGLPWDIASGTDGSLAVLVEGHRVDRYEDGRLVGRSNVTPDTAANPVGVRALAPDNCAALSVGLDVVELSDLGCFRGSAPRRFPGTYAAWSPDGDWIAVAQSNAVVFHRVVGPAATVRWDVAVGQLAWVGG